MALRSSNKINPNFNMSSLTDIIFLLLIFFMLTSTFVTPNALNLLLPSSNSQTTVSERVSVSVTQDLDYYVGSQPASLEELPDLIQQEIADQTDPTVVLNAEKTVPIEHIVNIMNIANDLNVKMILATRPIKE